MSANEASDRYAWPDIYATYLQSKESGACDNETLEPELNEACFVGPVRVGLSKGRGRGLFVTQNVQAGQLLFCAQAAVAGGNSQLLPVIVGRMLQSVELQQAVLNLSRGTPESETALPSLPLAKLVEPASMGGGAADLDASVEQLQEILNSNLFALPQVNTGTSPIEISSNPQRSGLWLLSAFVNHSCWPNVTRVVVRDHMFVRATRDLAAGMELLDCYIDPLQPLTKRREMLKSYGFRCNCQRCWLESTTMDSSKVEQVLRNSAHKGGMTNDAVEQAEALVARSLSQFLSKSKSKSMPKGLSLPNQLIEPGRAAWLREGLEQSDDPKEIEAFLQQDRLYSLLLAGLSEVIRARAVACRITASRQESTLTWNKLLYVLREVQPYSGPGAAISSEVLTNKLLDMKESASPPSHAAVHAVTMPAVHACHLVYGGGIPVWTLLFPQPLLSSLCPEWEAVLGRHCSGTADVLKHPAGGLSGGPSPTSPKTDEDLRRRTASYELIDSDLELTVLASFPGIMSASQIELDVSDSSVRLTTNVPECTQCLEIPLPQTVDSESCSAKWIKRTQVLKLSFNRTAG